MTNVENSLLKQMQKLAASLSAMQGAASKDKGNQANVSFQEMMQQSGGKISKQPSSQDAPAEKPLKSQEDELEEGKLPEAVQEKDETLKPENLVGTPNVAAVMDMFRPEIVEAAVEQPVEAVLNPIPQEAVQETAMDLSGQMPQMETAVDTSVGTEVSMEQQPESFGQTMEETPMQKQEQPDAPQMQVRQEAAPERTESHPQSVQTERTELPEDVEVKVEVKQESDETGGEAAAVETPVFHETHAVPVKVGERYETVDTQQPEMEAKLANVIQDAVQTGGERIQIHLAPQNLGSLVIEMTKDANGALQVVLHASNSRAAGVLNQHLDGLHNALQGYGHEEVHVEVQRGQESQEQHFKHADPDGRGQQQRQQHQERHEDKAENGQQEFLQKLRLGLFGSEDL